jgi:hypothetical protein
MSDESASYLGIAVVVLQAYLLAELLTIKVRRRWAIARRNRALSKEMLATYEMSLKK